MDAFNMPLKSQNSTTLKLLVVGILIFVCLVPTIFVWILLSERTNRQEEAIQEITDKWGASQVIIGPILSLPYSKTSVDSQGFKHESIGILNVLPQTLNHNAVLDPEIRSRGIFDTVVYKAKIDGQGVFAMPDFAYTDITSTNIQWDKAYIAMGVTDTRGIIQQVNLRWNGATIIFEPGSKNPVVGTSGIHAFTPIDAAKKTFEFAYSFTTQGGEKLEFLPLGSESKVHLQSSWNSPSFTGAYLPNERDVADGFSASWTISSFGRSYPNQWIDSEVTAQTLSDSRFGVSLIQNVDFYTKINR
ncbi:MAG: inner membrane CreD family protein, partial [Candidatus Daviesbacteria bacterium]|nr:inner membrane CreD family protein [Candidatus Daviesbacteria bacterium]